MRSLLLVAIVIVAGAIGMMASPPAQRAGQMPPLTIPSMSGKDLFDFYCAACHGRDGKGAGPVAAALATRPADLTSIARRSGGTFPRARVEAFVASDGDLPIAAHGTKDMPVWGPIFRALDPSDTRAAFRIENVVKYVESMQVLESAAADAGDQRMTNRCAQCHFANFFDVPGAKHLGDWEASAHARHDVGCERCHGGDATTYHRLEAHRGVLDSRSPASPVNRANLPLTCGSCHGNVLVAFRKSRHFALLTEGNPTAPSCSTCHGVMTDRVPSPRVLETQCAGCHRPDLPGGTYPAEARALLTDANRLAEALRQIDWAIGAVRGVEQRGELRKLHGEAVASAVQVAEAVHSFDLQLANRRLQSARLRVDDLFRRLNASAH